jgi:hypothetical protein
VRSRTLRLGGAASLAPTLTTACRAACSCQQAGSRLCPGAGRISRPQRADVCRRRRARTYRAIQARPVCEGARLHFVDDRLETLKAASEAGLGDRWQLYLADWCVGRGVEACGWRQQGGASQGRVA